MDNYHDLEQFLEEEQELAELGEMGNNVVQLPPIIMDHFDPFMCSDYDFWQRYRFTKDSVSRLSMLVFPEPYVTDRGKPMSREQVTCVALHQLADGGFHRVQGECSWAAKSTFQEALYRFVSALRVHKAQFVHMPTRQMMEDNARCIQEKYHLWNVVAGIDGCHVVFKEAPRGLDPYGDPKQKLFINRKGSYSLNCLVTGGFDHKIYDIVINVPGSFHDSSVYRLSRVKAYLETLYPRVYVLGDKAFRISDVMITPFKRNVPDYNNDKILFNIRHSGARTEMTENIYGLWKRRFPILNCVRLHLQNAIAVIEATAILHNISILWGDLVPLEMMDEAPPGHDDAPEDDVVVDNRLPNDVRRQQGFAARDALMRRSLQTPPSASERQKMRRHR